MFSREDPDPPIQLGLNRVAPADSPDVPAAESLQFRKAETTAEKRSCAFCRKAIDDTYYHTAGRVACPVCAKAISARQARRSGSQELACAFLYGLGAALIGSALFAVVALVAHVRLGLLAIVVGVMVGKAVVYGADGCRGLRFQILAVLLTYFSIGSSYVPLYIAAAQHHRAANVAAASDAPVSPRAVTPATAAGALALVLISLTALSLAAPFLQLARGLSGLIGLVIVFVGLQQAWRYARATKILILGPYSAHDLG
jgi:hypothetical protein